MTKIVILGAGVMGSALSVPAAASPGNQVTLVGSPLDDELVDAVQRDRAHPTLKASIPEAVRAIKLSELDASSLVAADIIVIGVSSPGMDWVTKLINQAGAEPALLGLVTKGLVHNPDNGQPPLTYADALPQRLPSAASGLVGIGGPCIARELALGMPTRVVFASRDIQYAKQLRAIFETDYYRITTRASIVAVEACAALKNFFCIGVSAMLSAYPLDDSHAKNPVAALFNQAVQELLILSRWIVSIEAGQHSGNDAAFDLAGMGDLHVTVGGGRNSRLGNYLGRGRRLQDIIATDMAGVTVEGVDTGRRLAPGFKAACNSGKLSLKDLPLTHAILRSIEQDELFNFDFSTLPD